MHTIELFLLFIRKIVLLIDICFIKLSLYVCSLNLLFIIKVMLFYCIYYYIIINISFMTSTEKK